MQKNIIHQTYNWNIEFKRGTILTIDIFKRQKSLTYEIKNSTVR